MKRGTTGSFHGVERVLGLVAASWFSCWSWGNGRALGVGWRRAEHPHPCTDPSSKAGISSFPQPGKREICLEKSSQSCHVDFGKQTFFPRNLTHRMLFNIPNNVDFSLCSAQTPSMSLLSVCCLVFIGMYFLYKNTGKIGIKGANPSPGWIQTVNGEGITSDSGFSWLQVPSWQFQVSHSQL